MNRRGFLFAFRRPLPWRRASPAHAFQVEKSELKITRRDTRPEASSSYLHACSKRLKRDESGEPDLSGVQSEEVALYAGSWKGAELYG